MRRTICPTFYDRYVIIVVFVFLFTNAVMGPLRYYIVSAGFEPLAYFPQALIFLALVLYILITFVYQRISKIVLCIFIILFIASLVGTVYVSNLPQVLFGNYVLLPFIFGVLAYYSFSLYLQKLRPWFLVLFIVIGAGVLFDAIVEMPWRDFSYDLANFNIEGTRAWTTFGFKRLAGFSRASFSAAIQILLTGLFLVAFDRRSLMRSLIWIVTGVVIMLTVTKGVYAAYLVLTAFLLFWRVLPNKIWVAVAVGFLVLSIVLPVSTIFHDYDLSLQDPVSMLLFDSFNNRLTYTWPETFEMLYQHGNCLLGRGSGGIGTAQKYFEPAFYRSADNLFIHLYGVFGVFGLIALVYFVINTYRLDIRHNPTDRYYFALVLVVLTYGLTTAIIESSVFAFFVGLSAVHISKSRKCRSPSCGVE